MRTVLLFVAMTAAALVTGCGGGSATTNAQGPGRTRARALGDGRPPLAVVARAGDGRSALAVAVSTEGIAPERGAVPAVALAALVEARLSVRIDGGAGETSVTTVGGWGGWRLRALVESASDATALVAAVRTAMLAPV